MKPLKRKWSAWKIVGTALAACVICGILIVALNYIVLMIEMEPILRQARTRAREKLCALNMTTLGTAMIAYAEENEDRFPQCSKWCNELHGKYVSSRWRFLCPERVRIHTGSDQPLVTDYGFNESLSGIRIFQVRDPARTVLAFEAERGQNVSGGPDRMIKTPRHGEGFIIVFVDGHTETVPNGELGKLVWTVTER